MNADLDATLARLKPGDEVTATFCISFYGDAFTITGTIWGPTSGALAVGRETVRFKNGARGHFLTDLVINKPAPDPEPPMGSVVLDADDKAWQLLPYGPLGTPYWESAAGNTRLSWWRLNDIYAPLRVIYTPEVES